ncbi:hypothetical protein [Spirosoma sp.]|nr:hypothetical protein [Spirosoma sp.]
MTRQVPDGITGPRSLMGVAAGVKTGSAVGTGVGEGDGAGLGDP